LPYAETVYWSVHPLALAEIVLPRLFGSILDSPTLWTYVLVGRNQQYYVCIFVGFLPIFFAWLRWSEGAQPPPSLLCRCRGTPSAAGLWTPYAALRGGVPAVSTTGAGALSGEAAGPGYTSGGYPMRMGRRRRKAIRYCLPEKAYLGAARGAGHRDLLDLGRRVGRAQLDGSPGGGRATDE